MGSKKALELMSARLRSDKSRFLPATVAARTGINTGTSSSRLHSLIRRS